MSREFVDQCLQQLTLAQKVGQMTMGERMWVTPQQAAQYSLGAILSGGGSHPGDNHPQDWVQMNDEYWHALVEQDGSVGIPMLFGVDAVHGHNNVAGATLFPHNIGLGAANDPELMAQIGKITAKEILASGLEWNFAPTLAVAQDCHWGRTYESFGSNVKRVAELGEAYVRALQAEGVMGCVKHWVGDGGTEHGIDQGETTLDWEALEATHVAPYYPSLEAGVLSVMVSFNSWNGEKCHGHQFLVTKLLKEQLGFDGIVISDWDGINYLDENFDEAIVKSVNAGLDMFMVPEHWQTFVERLILLVEEGRVSMARIDDAVRRILTTKSRAGLLDMPKPSLRENCVRSAKAFGSDAHRAVARQAVQKSLVLLKNEDNLLPLSPQSRVLVAGRNAHNLGNQCGGWSLSWQGESGNDELQGTSIWAGIQEIAHNASLSLDVDGADADPEKHDVAVVVVGERAYAEGFGDIRHDDNLIVEMGSQIQGLTNPLEPYGHSLELAQLHPEDLQCIRTIAAKGVPVVVVLTSGRPLVINAELALADAFVAAWLPGTEGAGVADVLFGQVPFNGKLPLPWPKDNFEQKVDSSKERPYETLFEEGYGLTTVAFGSPNIDNVVGMDYKSGSMK